MEVLAESFAHSLPPWLLIAAFYIHVIGSYLSNQRNHEILKKEATRKTGVKNRTKNPTFPVPRVLRHKIITASSK